jgi:hypothetical protein
MSSSEPLIALTGRGCEFVLLEIDGCEKRLGRGYGPMVWVRKLSVWMGPASGRGEQKIAELADAGTGIDDDHPSVKRPHLQKGCVAP